MPTQLVACSPVGSPPALLSDGPAALEAAMPVPNSKAVTANLAGDVSGSIVIVVSPDIAAALENGPVGPQELAAALDPALTDATSHSRQLTSVLFVTRLRMAIDAAAAVGSDGGNQSVTVVPLLSG